MKPLWRLLICAVVAASLLPAATYYVTLAGLGGEDDYEQRFTGWAGELDKLFKESAGAVNVHTLHGGDATRERFRQVLSEISTQAGADDRFAGADPHAGIEQVKFLGVIVSCIVDALFQPD